MTLFRIAREAGIQEGREYLSRDEMRAILGSSGPFKFKSVQALDAPDSIIDYGGAVSSAANRWLSAVYTIEGTKAAGSLSAPNYIQVTDRVVSPDEIEHFYVVSRIGAESQGTRSGIRSDIGVNGAVTGDHCAYVSHSATGFASVPGGDGTFTTDPGDGYKFSLFGGNDNVRLGAGATNWLTIYGREIDVQVLSGASCFSKIGLLIHRLSNDAARGSYEDAAILITQDPAAGTTWQHGVQFGGVKAAWPFASDSKLITAIKRVYPTGPSYNDPVADYGVDFSPVTFTTGAFKSTGFLVNPTGKVTATKLNIQDIPTSATGLSAGDVWSNSGVLTIV